MDKIDIRRQTRECAMQLLYEMEIHNNFSADMKVAFLNRIGQLRDYEERPIEGNDETVYPIETDYFNRIVNTVQENSSKIDQILEASAQNWKIDRISKVDLSVLRLSIAEIRFLDDIPVSVSINEAVELAKKFGGDDSGKFVNGVLGKVAKETN